MIEKIVPRRGRIQSRPGDNPVVLLHGTLGSPGNFQRLEPLINRPVVGIEYGRRGTASLEQCLADLRREFAALGPCDIVGHSLGGMMAFHMANEFPVGTVVGLGACYRGVPRHRSIVRLLGKSFVDIANTRFIPRVPQCRIVSIVSDADAVVPEYSAAIGEVIRIHGVPHSRLTEAVGPVLHALGQEAAPGASFQQEGQW